MNDLIEALKIFAKYGTPERPTHCKNDELFINPEISPIMVSDEDIDKLVELGFFWTVDNGEEVFKSFKFGNPLND